MRRTRRFTGLRLIFTLRLIVELTVKELATGRKVAPTQILAFGIKPTINENSRHRIPGCILRLERAKGALLLVADVALLLILFHGCVSFLIVPRVCELSWHFARFISNFLQLIATSAFSFVNG